METGGPRKPCIYSCRIMAVEHYENFPVASILLPPPLREPVAAIYAFARSADDFADEGDRLPAERTALLAGYQAELDAIDA
jgi:phytoene/squalene synthetase